MKLTDVEYNAIEFIGVGDIEKRLEGEGEAPESISEFIRAPRNPLSGTSIASIEPGSMQIDGIAELEDGESWAVVCCGGYDGLTNDCRAVIEVKREEQVKGYLVIHSEPQKLDNFKAVLSDEDMTEEDAIEEWGENACYNLKEAFSKHSHVVLHM